MKDVGTIENPVKKRRMKTGGRQTRDGIPHKLREVCYNETCTVILLPYPNRFKSAIDAGLCNDCWKEYASEQYHARQGVVTDRPLTDSEYNQLLANKARRISELDVGGDDRLYAIMKERGVIKPDADKANLTADDKIKMIKEIAPEINIPLLRLALRLNINPPSSDED